MCKTIISFYFTLSLLILVQCSSKPEKDEETPTGSVKSSNPVLVEIMRAPKKTFQFKINAKGRVTSENISSIRFSESGIIEDVLITPGQNVRKNEVLCILNSDESRLLLEKAQSTVKEKEIIYKDLIAQYSGGDSSEVSESIQDLYMIKSGLLAARIGEKEAQNQLDNSKIAAPFSGKVAKITVQEGDMVKASDEFCLLYNPRQIEIDSKILESDRHQLSIGSKANVSVYGNNQEYSGKIKFIDNVVNDQGLIGVKISLDEKVNFIPGMHASISFLIPKDSSIVVPKKAVIIRSGKPVIFTHEDGFAKWHYVQTGDDNGDEIEILEGISMGSEVITSNNIQLAHDSPVEVRKSE